MAEAQGTLELWKRAAGLGLWRHRGLGAWRHADDWQNFVVSSSHSSRLFGQRARGGLRTLVSPSMPTPRVIKGLDANLSGVSAIT